MGESIGMIKIQKAKIIYIFFITTILCSIAYLVGPFFVEKHIFKKLNKELAQKTTLIDNYIQKKEKLLEELALNQLTLDLFKTEETEINHSSLEYQKHLDELFEGRPGLYHILVIKKEGDVLFTQKESSTFIGKNITHEEFTHHWLREFFNQATTTQTTDSFITKIEKKDFLISYTPIIKNSETLGFIFSKTNPSALFSMIQEQKTLKKTDLLISKYTNKLRHIPLNEKQKENNKGKFFFDSYLIKASQGDASQAIIKNEHQELLFASWRHYPRLNVGILVKSPYTPARVLSLILLILLILSLSFSIFLFYKNYHTNLFYNSTKYWKSLYALYKVFIPHILLGLCIASLLITLANYKQYETLQNAQTLQRSKDHLQDLSQKLNIVLSQIRQAALVTKQQLQTSTFSEDQLNEFALSLLQNNSNIYNVTMAFEPYTFDESRKFFAPSWMRTSTGVDKTYLGKSYDYLSSEKGKWYRETLEKKSLWEIPTLDSVTNKKIIFFSILFYKPTNSIDKKPSGVLRIGYRVAEFNKFIDSLGYRTHQRTIITNKKGAIIYHPKKEYQTSNKTIFTLAPMPSLNQSEAFFEHFKEIIPSFTWHVEGPIQETEWTLACAFDKSDFDITKKTSLFKVFIILWSLFILLFILLISLQHSSLIKTPKELLLIGSKCYIGLISIGIILLWTLAYQQPWISNASISIIKDRSDLNLFLESIKQKSIAVKPLIPIKTGFVIKEIDYSLSTKPLLIATAWQTYNKKMLKLITPGITITNAKKITVEKAFKHEEKGIITIGWNIKATLVQKPNYENYPFNKKDLIINLQHTDKKNNIICIPDFKGYEIAPNNPLPWINTPINNLNSSFFTYSNVDEPITILKKHRTLNLHIITQENMLNSFIADIIPLIIGLFAIFALLWLDPANRISGFSGLLFAFIFLHRALRGSLNLTSITYLEYFFLTTYITLLIVTAMASIAAARKVPDEESKYYFWPIQTTAWLILTIALFFY